MQPGQRALDDPAGPPQAAPVRSSALGQLRRDAAERQLVPMGLGIVAAVALHQGRLAGRTTDPAPQGGHGIDQREQLRHVVPVRRREARDKRNPVRVGKNMMFRPGFAAIGRVRSSFFPPRSARSEALSTTARARSNWRRRRNSASNTACSRRQTPVRCHRTSRR